MLTPVHRRRITKHSLLFLTAFCAFSVLCIGLTGCAGLVSGTRSASTTTPPPDTTPPTVSMIAPVNGATVSGTAAVVSANATDNVAVASVQFQLDGANLGTAITAAPYSFSWDSTKTSNGSHTLRAVATDTSKNSATSAAVTVTVSNTSTSPVTVPSGLTATAVSSSEIDLSWNASTGGSGGVAGYKVYRGGTQIATTASTSYKDTGLAPSTSYGYNVAAYDGAGNTSAQSSGASATTQGSGSTAPSISGVSPTSGAVGTAVTISGANFGATQGTSTVKFNGTAATPTSWSATSIVAALPSGATTENVVVTVGGVASNGVSFTVTTAAAPSISGVSPTSGAVGTSVTISGANFGSTQGTSTVKFNGTAAT